MAAKKRSGLGRGIGALIPQAPANGDRPVDVFFPAGGASAAQNNTAESKKNASSPVSEQTDATTINPIGDILKVAQKASQEQAFLAGQLKKTTDETENGLKQVPGAILTQLELSDIIPNRVNPRKEFDTEALKELSFSIKEFGVFQPIVVRPISPQPAAGNPRYELIMGERRYRASKLAGLSTIPAIIRVTEDENMLRDALLENLHRAELNPLEEASAYQQLMQDFGITQEQLANKIGRSRPQISNTIRLLKLPESLQLLVVAGKLTAGHARALLSLENNPAAMQKLGEQVVARNLTVRETENAVAQLQKPKLAKVRPGTKTAKLDAAAKRLSERFDTKVAIKLGAKKGQVVIDFATIGQLQQVLEILGDEGL